VENENNSIQLFPVSHNYKVKMMIYFNDFINLVISVFPAAGSSFWGIFKDRGLGRGGVNKKNLIVVLFIPYIVVK
jgi:hypothetical protein